MENALYEIPISPRLDKTTGHYGILQSGVKDAISYHNVPIALLTLWEKSGSGQEPKISTWHWVTVFGWETYDGHDYIKYKTWGLTFTDDFRQVYRWRAGLALVNMDETVN